MVEKKLPGTSWLDIAAFAQVKGGFQSLDGYGNASKNPL
jgi:hypothetical protein